jgi:hypothetical protein
MHGLEMSARTGGFSPVRMPSTRDADSYNLIGGSPFQETVEASAFDQAARSLVAGVDFKYSGSYGSSISLLRVMYYVFASEHYGIPYLPSVMARPLGRKFPNYFQPSARAKIYEQLASALRSTVDTVAQEFDDATVFVPPFSALVLSRAATPAEIPAQVLAVRAEYAGFRRKMGREAARAFDQPAQMKLDAAVRYIPDVVDLTINPTNPVQWIKTLINLPTETLLAWYRRRPVAKLISTASTVGSMQDYSTLLHKHFGETAADVLDTLRNF